MEEKLGKIAMRIIGFGILGALVLVLVAKGVDGFPFEVWGLIGGIILCVAAFAVGWNLGLTAWGAFAAMIGASILLGGVFLALGLLASTLVRQRSTAGGIAIGSVRTILRGRLTHSSFIRRSSTGGAAPCAVVSRSFSAWSRAGSAG